MPRKKPNWIEDPSGIRRVVGFTIECPYCQSDKWRWIESLPIKPEELSHHLLTRIHCEKCGKDFLYEDKRRTKFVNSVEICGLCGSDRIEKTSRTEADLELWFCNKCRGYMALRPNEKNE